MSRFKRTLILIYRILFNYNEYIRGISLMYACTESLIEREEKDYLMNTTNKELFEYNFKK